MKMEEQVKKFNIKDVQKLLHKENDFIVDALTTFDVPDFIEDDRLEEMYLLNSKNTSKAKNFGKINRAQDAEDLQDRMEIIKNKMNSKRSKMSERTIKKREMKKLKKEKMLKKQIVSVHKTLKNEKMKEEKVSGEERQEIAKQIKPIFNEEGKIVFSKFDFASHPGAKVKKTKSQKVIKNPQAILNTIQEQKKKVSELIEKGEKEEAREMKQELAWKKAFDKTEGKKVKDDPTLLHKAVKKRKDQKKKSKQKWAERTEKVEQDILQRQKKRTENINKKLKEKKTKKLKRASKKGRVIPGF